MRTVTERTEQKPSGAGSADPPPAITGISMEGDEGVHAQAEAADAPVPTRQLLLLLLRVLLLSNTATRSACEPGQTLCHLPILPSIRPSISASTVRRPYCVPGPGLDTRHLAHSPLVRGRLPPSLLHQVGAADGGFHRRTVQKAQVQNPGERRRPGARVSEAARGPLSGAQVAPPLPSRGPPLSSEGRVWLLRAGKEGLRGI